MTTSERLRSHRAGSAFAVLLLAYGGARFVKAALLPASRALAGDFAAVFPSPYFARFRPDFPTNQVWDGGWYSGPMLHFLTLPLLALPKWWMVPPAWALINLVALTVSFLCLCKLSGVMRDVSWRTVAVLAGFWLLFQPLGTAFASGNIELIEMAFILAAVVGLQSRRDGVSGALLGAATMLKFLPIGFLAWCVLRRRWRAVWAGAAMLGAVLIATALTLGWKDSVLAAAMGSQTGWSNAGFHELSVTSMFLHRAGMLDAAEPAVRWFPSARADVAVWAGQIASALLAAGVAWLLILRRNRAISPVEVSALFLTMFIAVPRNHDYYYVFALVPVSILWLRGIVARDAVTLALTVGAYLLMSLPISFSWIDRAHVFQIPVAYVVNFHDLPVWGGLTLWLVITAQLWQEHDAQSSSVSSGRGRAVVIGVGGLVLSALIVWVAPPSRATATENAMTLRPLLRSEAHHALALSPDGARLAYVSDSGVLCTRVLAESDAACWPDTAGARSPFFSPDGRWIAFFAVDELRKIPARGGAAQRIVNAVGGTSGSWDFDRTLPTLGRGGVIVFAAADGIHRIDDAGVSTLIVPALAEDGRLTSPVMLPSADTVVFAVDAASGTAPSTIVAQSLATGRRERLLSGRQPHLDRVTGRLVYLLSGRVMSVPLRLDSLTVGDIAEPLTSAVAAEADGAAQFALSDEGTLVFVPAQPGPPVRRTLQWVDRHGAATTLPIAANDFEGPRISPDGRRVVVSTRGLPSESWLVNIDTGAPLRLSAGAEVGATPVWAPDGRSITLSAEGPVLLSMPVAAGTGQTEVLWRSRRALDAQPVWLGGWTRDGRWLVGAHGGGIWLFDSTATLASQSRTTWFDSLSPQRDPVVSPDGRWIAYVAEEAGRSAVFLRSTFAPGVPQRVSGDGEAAEPAWSFDGHELFFRQGDRLMSTQFTGTGSSVIAPPVPVFGGRYASATGRGRNYDVSPDGQHFVMVSEPQPENFVGAIRVLRRWSATLGR